MARILITGGSGYLGHILTGALSNSNEVHVGQRHPFPISAPVKSVLFDVSNHSELRNVFSRIRPDCVVHTAALTKPDYCESRPDETRSINVEGTRHIVDCCREVGAKLVHISTDLVFDGKRGNYSEEDPVEGINEYSRSKIEAERIVLEQDPSAVILRVSVLYGPGNRVHPGFLDEIMSRWRGGQAMTFFTDQFRTPTFGPQVGEAVERILQKPEASGLFHLGGAERLSRLGFGELLAKLVGAPAHLLQSSSMHSVPATARRGADCSLNSEKIARVLGVQPARCIDGLSKLVDSNHLERLVCLSDEK